LIKFAETDLLKCCGSRKWARAMAEHAFPNAKEVLATADSIWRGLTPQDWEEAFDAHVPIGDRTDLAESTPQLMERISQLATSYRERFDRPFVSTALGKNAAQILKFLEERLEHEPDAELRISAEQQLQITHNRLKRLLPRT